MDQPIKETDANVGSRRRWGVVLAGGDGTRLRRLTRLICGDDRPKQFCPLIGGATLLEQTRIRAERSIPGEQILFPLSRSHQAFYAREAGVRPSQRIVQPENKGTLPPILCSLLSIEQLDKDAVVAILPCDHHYSEERAFSEALESAFGVASQCTGSVVLLGAPAQSPEVEYGWIELGSSACDASYHVRGFCEKPSLQRAQILFEHGSLWNTFVMVGHVQGFLQLMRAALSGVVAAFRDEGGLWAGKEVHIPDSLYERIQPINFSHDVLSAQATRLSAIRLSRGAWHDLGDAERVISVLESAGMEPWWMKEWLAPRRSPSAVDRLRMHTAASA